MTEQRQHDKGQNADSIRNEKQQGRRDRPQGAQDRGQDNYRPRAQSGGQDYNRPRCSRCGFSHFKTCPAKGKMCNKCRKFNHFSSMCRSTQKCDSVRHSIPNPDLQEPESGSEYDDEELESDFRNFSVDSVDIDEKPWRVNLKIRDHPVDFKIDTGADVNIISKAQYEKLPVGPLQITPIIFNSPGGTVKPLGFFTANLKNKKKKKTVKIYVLDNNVDNLLSRGTANFLNLIKRVDSQSATFAKINCEGCP